MRRSNLNAAHSIVVQTVLALFLAAFTSNASRADEADNAAIVTAFNTVGYELFKQLVATPGNVALSPYSIGSVMAMASSGATGDTAAEMTSVLHQQFNRDRVDVANADVLAILKSYGAPAASPTCPNGLFLSMNRCASVKRARRGCPDMGYGQGTRCVEATIESRSSALNVANAIMLTKDAVVSDAYVNRLERDYAAKIFRDAGPVEVNSWVNRVTGGKIDHILDRLVSEGLVLINTVYLKQAWRNPFVAKETTSEDFHLSPNKTIKVATMHKCSDFPVVSRPGFRAIRLSYDTRSLSMVIILPDTVDGTTPLAQRLDASELNSLLVSLRQSRVYADLSLPRFRMSFAVELKSKFEQLGMVRPFDKNRADFSGITGRQNDPAKLWIDKILHRVAIEVTENGTEAAAATAISVAEVLNYSQI